MKLLWHSLLVSLGILLPTATSTVLAESLKTAESVERTPSPVELLPVSDAALVEMRSLQFPTPNNTSPTPEAEVEVEPLYSGSQAESRNATIHHELAPLPSDHVVVEERLLAQNPDTIVLPNMTLESPPDLRRPEEFLDIPTTLVLPDIAPVSPPSDFRVENTQSQEDREILTAPIAEAPVEEVEAEDKTDTTSTPSTEESGEESEAAENPETPSTSSTEDSATPLLPELSPEETARQQKLIEADRLYMRGDFAAAQRLYREAKAPFEFDALIPEQPVAIYDPAELSPAGAVYWRQSEAGLEQQLETKILVPLRFLVEQQPEFIPGHVRYAEALRKYNREEEALQVLERATSLYPNEPELLKAKITALGEAKQWLEASLAARQFALFNFNHPQAEEFEVLAEQNLQRYKSHLRSRLRGNAIANVITGALGYIFTGNLFGPISAIETTVLMLRGESAVGERIAGQVQRQLPLLEDEEVLEYVREVGNKLATVAGRDEFEYEFYVINDERLNAFALPGGKIFVNAGAILKTQSEAELAGLLAHELAHAVLSHGFKLVTEGNLIANITQYIPFGGTATNLIVLDYSREMEREADDLGTRILVAAGYAADGLHNLMVTLAQEERDRPLFAWLSTHPDTEERIRNLETLIKRNGYNRYTYEGVARHRAIQERVAKLLKEYKAQEEE